MWRVLNERFCRMHPAAIIAVCLLLAVLVAWLDYVSGVEMSLALLYVVPVVLAAWYVGPAMGSALAVVGAAGWVLDDFLSGHRWELVFARYWDAVAVHLGFFLVVAWLAARLHRQLDREARRARTDGLTGALNWRAFVEEAGRLAKLALREGGAVTLAYLDIDDFKSLNDTRGHVEGDRLLVAVRDALARSLRDSDVVARLGGDEFGVLLPMTDEPGARAVVERARQHLADAAAAGEWPVTFSIGVVTFPFPPQSVEEAVSAADALMYRVKNGGKNGVAYETAATTARAS
jgi:diguanylate cyclase (GGDEF)-like protein